LALHSKAGQTCYHAEPIVKVLETPKEEMCRCLVGGGVELRVGQLSCGEAEDFLREIFST